MRLAFDSCTSEGGWLSSTFGNQQLEMLLQDGQIVLDCVPQDALVDGEIETFGSPAVRQEYRAHGPTSAA